MKKLLIGNWKMNPDSPDRAEEIFSAVKKSPGSTDVEVVIIAPDIYIPLFKNRGISLGSQNIHHEEKGAFTGETSAKMVKNSGCKYVLVGHSERRRLFNEKDEEVKKKIIVALENDLIPILCVGETKVEKNKRLTSKVIKGQLEEALTGIDFDRLVVGYEPVWAIGSGEACNPETAFKMRLLIKKTLTQLTDRQTAEEIPIVYGGSVNLGNCKRYVNEAKFNGLLVGGASLRAKEFSRMAIEIS